MNTKEPIDAHYYIQNVKIHIINKSKPLLTSWLKLIYTDLIKNKIYKYFNLPNVSTKTICHNISIFNQLMAENR